MSARRRGSPRASCLKVVPQPSGAWLVINDRNLIVSSHLSATEAERAATARLPDGDELVLFDRYHRCHTVRRAAHR